MNVERVVAGVFVGAGALLLILNEHVTEACILLGTMVGFFVGEVNGKRQNKS